MFSSFSSDWPIIALSLKVSLLSVLFMLPPSLFLGWLLAKTSFPGKSFLSALIHLPLVIPPVVTGFLLLRLLGRRGLIGSFLHEWFDFDIAFTYRAAVIAAMVMSLPLMVRAIRLSIESVDHRLEDAARTLGASRWHIFKTITLPLSLSGLITAIILGFARSLGEFGATITFAGNISEQTRTLPLAIYTATQTPGQDAQASRLVFLCILIAVAAVLLSEWLAKPKKHSVPATPYPQHPHAPSP